MRYRITVRGEGCELRGYLDDNDPTSEGLKSFAQLLYPFGIVVASPVEDDYDPFTENPADDWQPKEPDLREFVRRGQAAQQAVNDAGFGKPGLQQPGGSLGGF